MENHIHGYFTETGLSGSNLQTFLMHNMKRTRMYVGHSKNLQTQMSLTSRTVSHDLLCQMKTQK